MDERTEALDALTCIANSDFNLKRSLSSDALVPKSFSIDVDPKSLDGCLNMDPDSENPR